MLRMATSRLILLIKSDLTYLKSNENRMMYVNLLEFLPPAEFLKQT